MCAKNEVKPQDFFFHFYIDQKPKVLLAFLGKKMSVSPRRGANLGVLKNEKRRKLVLWH